MIEFAGEAYQTVEHAYQAAKTLDLSERAHIRGQSTPGKAKRAGRGVTLRPEWDEVKVGTMRRLLRQKFAPGTELAAELLATGSQELIEGNRWGDTFWGICRGGSLNVFGNLLMEIRSELRQNAQLDNRRRQELDQRRGC